MRKGVNRVEVSKGEIYCMHRYIKYDSKKGGCLKRGLASWLLGCLNVSLFAR